jgi:thiamine biosynthesis lipoprotein
MYDPASEISIFNQQPTGTAMKISPDFHAVLKTAAHLYRLTDGAWDGTVKPLVDLWGFGTQKGSGRVPETGRIARALANTGFKHIEISPGHRIQKHRAVTLDLGSIAKGYGVDAVAQLFVSSGITDLLVEIGGELYGSGTNKRGKPWSVGISRPDKRYANQSLYKIIRLENQAIATSGTYRNFFEMDQKTFAHIIDPRTGFPVDNNIVSASVIAQDCTLADGLATALMVMDVQKGIDLVNRLDSTECLIIEKRGQTLVNHPSKKFNDLVKE